MFEKIDTQAEVQKLLAYTIRVLALGNPAYMLLPIPRRAPIY